MTEPADDQSTLNISPWIPVALGILALALGALALYFFVRDDDDHPANDSADVGFMRDMSVHHAQAVEMANIAYRRTDDLDIARLARDIADTQQFQIGMMTGWLDIWGLPVSSDRPLMAWMEGHFMVLPSPPPGLEDDDSMAGMDMEDMDHSATPESGSDAEVPVMPGMATTTEVKELETLPVDEMNAQFLRLMIRHHQGGVAMAQSELELGKEDIVRNFAQQVINTQDAEIATMTTMLANITSGSDTAGEPAMNPATPVAATPVAATPMAGTPVAATPGTVTPESHDEGH
jgi:uncharacterized protein (DUF305 family)